MKDLNASLRIDRLRLKSLTTEIAFLLEERAAIVRRIQSFKKQLGPANSLASYPDFMPEVERSLFQSILAENPHFSLEIIFLISMVIETMAGPCYPRWSCGAHLDRTKGEILEKWQQVNPLLLKLSFPQYISQLKMKDSFASLVEIH